MKYTVSFLLIVVALFSCRKKPFQWQANWSAPIIDDSLSLKNFVNDSTLTEGSGGYYHVDLQRDLFSINLDELVKIPDTSLINNFSIASNVSVPPGFSFVNSIEEHTLGLEPILLKKIKLKGGEFKVELKNPYPTKVIFRLELPGVYKNGQLLYVEAEAPPGTQFNPSVTLRTVSLIGSDLDLTGTNGSESNMLLSKITVTTDPNGPSVQSTSSYVTSVKASFKNLQVDYARGYFGQQIFTDTVEANTELIKEMIGGYLDFPSGNMTLTLVNGLKVNAKVNLHSIMGENKDGVSIDLINSQLNQLRNLACATGAYGSNTPAELDYIFNGSNSNLENFLENWNSKIKVIYTLKINPEGNISGSFDEMFPNSVLKLRLKANLPLSFGIHHVVLRDTFSLNNDGITRQLDKTNAAVVRIITKNSLPIRSDLSLIYLDENENVLFQQIDALEVRSSLGAPLNKLGVSETTDEFSINFDKSKIDQLMKCKSIVVQLVLNTPATNGTGIIPVLIPLGAKLKLNAQLGINYTNGLE
jgi:hypothetical protein